MPTDIDLAGNRGQAALGLTRPDILQSPADISTLSPFLRNRAFMLFDSTREQPLFNHINIKVTPPGGEEIITRVPLSLLERKDSTLHKLGARALLGDLERRQSWIHLDPNAPPRGSTQEQELVRQEGEALGCKWSLVSKWTSFYAVEEPYHAAEATRIPFLDAEDIQIREVGGDLDLLRPRGVAAQQANLPAVPLPAALAAVEADDGSDDDEDTASNSDHMDMGSDGDGDSDSDDGGHNGGGGGAGGNQAGGSAGDQQRPNLGDSNADGDGGATGGNSDTQNDANLPNPPHFAAFDLDISRSRLASTEGFYPLGGAVESSIDFGETQSRLPEAADHTITYESPLVPPLPHASGAMPSSGSFSARVPNSSAMPSFFRGRPKTESPWDKNPLPSKRRRSSPKESYTGDSKDRDHYNTLGLNPSSYGDVDSSTASARSSSPSPSHERISDPWAPYNSSHPSLYQSIDPSNDSDRVYETSQAPFSHNPAYTASPLQPSITSYRPVQQSIPSIITPSFNLPASTAIHFSESRTPKSAQEIAGEQKIRNLLVFQSFDGSFNFDSVEQLRTHLGPGFASVVQDLQLRSNFKLAVTVGLMLLLGEKFEYCRDLWTLVYHKAADYLKSQRPSVLERTLLLESATLKVRALDMSQVLQTAASAQPVVLPPARGQILTQSSSPSKGSDDVETEPGFGRLNAASWEESGAAVGNEGSTKPVVLDTAPIED